MSKVFFIGMNRTGTKSFHHLFTQSGYESVHYSTYNPEGGAPIIIGEMISDRAEMGEYNRNPLLHGAERFTAYSDMFFHREHKWCDGVKVFKQLEAEYPDSYFVLQTREMEGWLRSKKNHKDGQYLHRSMTYHRTKSSDQMMEWFRKDRDEHHKAVRNHFKDSERFIEFDIEKDNIEKFINFMRQADIILLKGHWKHLGKSV
ncbi:hypothetical protein OAS42_00405 [bacterium]|nr:hypothetical protein [bacterium]